MAQLNKIRYADGRVVRPGEWTASPLYSSVDIDDATSLTALDAFSYGIGNDVPGSRGPRQSDLRDTNMQGQGSTLAENEHLYIFGLSIELYQRVNSTVDFFNGNETWVPDPPVLSLTNVLRLQVYTMLEMRIAATKDYLKVPLSFLPGARGVKHVLGSSRSEGSGYSEGVAIGHNGGVSEGDQRLLATPREVGPGEAFVVRFLFPFGNVSGLDFGADDTRVTARVFQRGIRRRPVA